LYYSTRKKKNSEIQIILVVQWWIFDMKSGDLWNNYSKPNVSNFWRYLIFIFKRQQ
jgi:hypothetical protein